LNVMPDAAVMSVNEIFMRCAPFCGKCTHNKSPKTANKKINFTVFVGAALRGRPTIDLCAKRAATECRLYNQLFDRAFAFNCFEISSWLSPSALRPAAM
jgi:hypothetical protein